MLLRSGAMLGALVVLGPGGLGAQPAAQPPASLAAEIARVRTAAVASVADGQREGLNARLLRAAAAAEQGRVLLALFELQPAWEMESAFTFVKGAEVATPQQFEAKWKAVGVPTAPADDGRRRAAFVEAIAQSSEARALKTYRASLPYAEDAGLAGGLFYLGESRAFGRFAAFCRALDIPPAGRAPALRAIAPELARLEADVLDAYEKADDASRQPFIVVSVTLKLARQLDGEGRHLGAWLQYLLARYRFALTRPAGSADRLAARLESARPAAGGQDHSLADFFVQLAGTHIAAASEPSLKAASAIVDDVLPAYRALVNTK